MRARADEPLLMFEGISGLCGSRHKWDIKDENTDSHRQRPHYADTECVLTKKQRQIYMFVVDRFVNLQFSARAGV